jgi:hypothetical protein
MGYLTIQQQVTGTLNGNTENLSTAFQMPITHATRTTFPVDNTWHDVLTTDDSRSPAVVFLNNLGTEDITYRVTSGSNYHLLNLPPGAFVVVHLSRSLALGDGDGNKTIAVTSVNGSSIETGVFY